MTGLRTAALALGAVGTRTRGAIGARTRGAIGTRTRGAIGTLALGALGLVAACRSSGPAVDAPEMGAPGASAASLASPALPVDHLAPAELLEGTEKALGVLLPRGLKVDESFGSVVYTSGPLAVHPLVQYFRARLKNGDLHEGTASATFEHVTAPGQTGPLLTVHIAQLRDAARVEFRDETPPPAPKLPDVAARWKNVGLTPNGRLADPSHLD